MQKIQRKAFTLVELLVVVVIIAMLMGLLTPAIVAARARARQVQCMNNMNEIGKALIQFDLSKQRFPGYAEKMPGQANIVNWAVLILPNIQRNDIWDTLRDSTNSITDNDIKDIKIELYICPSAQGKTTNQSYVVNTGQEDIAITATNKVSDWPSNGVFLDLSKNKSYKVTASQIPDGAQHTLLLSENLQAGNWNANELATPPAPLSTIEAQVGMIWYSSNTPGTASINKAKEKEINYTGPFDMPYARPSSNHSGGVNVIFCDGHAQFLREDIDYEVYGKLMTPDGKNSKYFNSGVWYSPVDWQNKPLNEDDYTD